MRRRTRTGEESYDYWPAFTDLIAAVSLVLFLVVLLAIAQAAVSVSFALQGRNELQRTLQAVQEEKRKADELVEGNKRVQEIFLQRKETTARLMEEIGAGQAVVDENATIWFRSSVLFAYDQYSLTEEARTRILPPVARALGRVLQEHGSNIAMVSVEGHMAGPPEDPLWNSWELAARRAMAVLVFLQQANPDLQRPELAGKLAATSYSYYRPPKSAAEKGIPLGRCRNALGECDDIRRIEIRLVLRDEGLQEEILKALGRTP